MTIVYGCFLKGESLGEERNKTVANGQEARGGGSSHAPDIDEASIPINEDIN